MAPPALQPRLTRPCPPAPQVPCVRRALVGGASRAHSTSPQASPLGAPPPSSVPLSTRPFVLLGTHPHPVYPPRITRPAQLRPQGPAVAPARLAAAPSSWVPERAGGRRWAQVGSVGAGPPSARAAPRAAPARQGAARPPARAEVIALSCVPSEINRSEPFPTRPSGPHWCVPAPLLPARGAGVRRWCQALACGEGTLSARLISRL